MDEPVKLTIEDGVAHIVLNRPDAANGINVAMADALLDAIETVAADTSVRAVLVRGAGQRFCAGGDLQAAASGDDPRAHVPAIIASLHPAITRLTELDVPVVAAVQGSAAGAGLGLAMSCDIVLVGASAKLVMAYTGIGVTPDASSSWFLPRLVGLRRALELTLTNRVLTAEEAVDWGLATSVVADEDLEERAVELATQLASGPTRALGGARRLLHQSETNTLDAQLALERDLIARMLGTADAKEGIGAFIARRPPRFLGG